MSCHPSGTPGQQRSRFRRWARGFLPSIVCVFLTATALPALAFTSEQVTQGADLFRRECQRCHGPYGEGRDAIYRGLRAPELIGRTALPLKPRPYQRIRQRDFRTAEDVFNFASAAMPADQPASMYAQEYWAVLSFVLAANGMQPDGQQLDDTSAAKYLVHPQDGQPQPGGGSAQQ